MSSLIARSAFRFSKPLLARGMTNVKVISVWRSDG